MKSSLRRRGISDVGVVPGDLVAEHPHKQGAHGNASNAAQNGLEPFRDPHARQHPTRGRAWATNPAGARVADSDQAATRDPAVRLDNAEGGGLIRAPSPKTRSSKVKAGRSSTHLRSTEHRNLAVNTPLSFCILRETELNRGRLTGVGAYLVAETFNGKQKHQNCGDTFHKISI